MRAGATCLQLDLGNSGAKWRLKSGNEVRARGRCQIDDRASCEAMLASSPQPEYIWVSSVAGPDVEQRLVALLGERWPVQPWFARTQARCGDLRNSYAEPGRMGVDRWLAMLASRARWPRRLCVVDAGSALTIDLVDARGQHEGGYILPGPVLMERALLLDTDRVRFDQDVAYGLAPGCSTAEAVRHGVALAQAGAVRLVQQRQGAEVPQLVFCGGGGEALMRLLDGEGRYIGDLVFEGLEIMAQAESQS